MKGNNNNNSSSFSYSENVVYPNVTNLNKNDDLIANNCINNNSNNVSDDNNNYSDNVKTANAKEKVFILGDSMVKKVNVFSLTRNINHKYLVKVKYFSSAKVSCMNDHVKSTLWDFNLEHIILHVGTNDLNTERTASQIAKSIVDLCQSLKTDTNTIRVSLIIPRYDNLNSKANELNGRLMDMCKERNIPYIDHTDTISPERYLIESNLHLNRCGILAFAKNFSKYLLELN